eukprot:355417-Chlamydomonas_euryale.AAC.3
MCLEDRRHQRTRPSHVLGGSSAREDTSAAPVAAATHACSSVCIRGRAVAAAAEAAATHTKSSRRTSGSHTHLEQRQQATHASGGHARSLGVSPATPPSSPSTHAAFFDNAPVLSPLYAQHLCHHPRSPATHAAQCPPPAQPLAMILSFPPCLPCSLFLPFCHFPPINFKAHQVYTLGTSTGSSCRAAAASSHSQSSADTPAPPPPPASPSPSPPIDASSLPPPSPPPHGCCCRGGGGHCACVAEARNAVSRARRAALSASHFSYLARASVRQMSSLMLSCVSRAASSARLRKRDACGEGVAGVARVCACTRWRWVYRDECRSPRRLPYVPLDQMDGRWKGV